jgi:hypothetical protein
MMLMRRKNSLISGIILRKSNNNPTSLHHLSKLYLSTITHTDSKKVEKEKESLDQRRETDVRILKELAKHLWPDNSHSNAFELKSRVTAAVSLLVASKLINIQVPFLFKSLVDSFEVDHTMLTSTAGDPLLMAIPISLVMGYGYALYTYTYVYMYTCPYLNTFEHISKYMYLGYEKRLHKID